jgi:hypothetical protein
MTSVYLLYETNDDGTPTKLLGAFPTRTDLGNVQHSKMLNWSTTTTVQEIKLTTAKEYLANKEQEIKRNALAKLSERERQLLGLE